MRKLFWIVVLIFVVFWMAYGLYEPMRTTINNWVTNDAGPKVTAWWIDFSGGISGTPAYQQYHVLAWVGLSLTAAYAIHQLHAAQKLPFMKRKETQAEPYQDRLEPQPPQQIPPQPVVIKVQTEPKPTTEPAPTKEENPS